MPPSIVYFAIMQQLCSAKANYFGIVKIVFLQQTQQRDGSKCSAKDTKIPELRRTQLDG
jgi:hypothetical protein